MKKLTFALLALLLAAACDNPTEPDTSRMSPFAVLDSSAEAGSSGGDYLALQVNDPRGDPTGAIDVRKMRLVFSQATGAYRIVLTVAKDAPFVGAFRININLYNPALGTSAYPAMFSHNGVDYDLAEPVTEIVLEGIDARLTQWEKGHEVYTNSLDGTGNPSGVSLFRSSVTNLPMGFLTNEDVIAPRVRSEPVKIHGAGKLPG